MSGHECNSVESFARKEREADVANGIPSRGLCEGNGNGIDAHPVASVRDFLVQLCGYDRCVDGVMTFADGVEGRLLRKEGDVCAALGHWSLFLDGLVAPVSSVTEQSLFSACRAGRTDAIDSIVSRYKIDVNSADEYGWSALHVAMVHRRKDVVRCLSRLQAANTRTNDGLLASSIRRNLWRRIHGASAELEPLVPLTIDKTVDALVGGMNDRRHVPELQVARMLQAVDCYGGAILIRPTRRCLGRVMKESEHAVWTVFHASAAWGLYSPCRVCLELGIDVNFGFVSEFTPLHDACGAGSADCVQLFLDAGVDVDAQTSSGWTALHRASENGAVDCVRRLLEFGADVRSTNSVGMTALHLACTMGHAECTQVLLDTGGVEVNTRNRWQETPLLCASIGNRPGHVLCIKLLLDSGAQVNRSTLLSRLTPLHRAVAARNADCVKVLLDAGANVATADANGYSALELARRLHATECFRLLTKAARTSERTQNTNGRGCWDCTNEI